MFHYYLFEYSSPAAFHGSHEDLANLEIFLEDLWERRPKSAFYYEMDKEGQQTSTQQLLNISHKHKTLRSNKYVGIIKYNDHLIELLPKVFNRPGKELSSQEIKNIQANIIWWLSYCHRKFKFPRSFGSFNALDAGVFETLIHLFAIHAKEILSKLVYHAYDEVVNDLPYMKGRLNMGVYIKNNMATGNWHRLNCTYDSFESNNLFNQIIKFVAKLLLNETKIIENKRTLRDVVFILDEVEDVQVSFADCQKVCINPMFSDLEILLDYCKLFLGNSMIFSYKKEFKVFAFLLPMEYIFEEFIYGFIRKELNFNVKSQSTLVNLTRCNSFCLKPDLLFYNSANKVYLIADTKYKIINRKDDISQNDLYQMVSYAIRYGCNEIFLFYPYQFSEPYSNSPFSQFEVVDKFSRKIIHIKAYKLPITNTRENLQGRRLVEMFEETRKELYNFLKNIL